VVVWTNSTFETGSTLLARRLGEHGKLGAIRTIAHDPEGEPELDVQSAMDGAGNTTIVWNRVHAVEVQPRGAEVTSASICVRRLTAAGSLGPVTCVPTEGGLDRNPRLAVAPSGRGVLTWIRSIDGRYAVQAALIRPDGTLGPALDVSAPSAYWSAGAADVAVDSRGRGTLAWSNGQSGDGVAMRQVSRRGLGPLHVFTTAGETLQPQVAATTSGAATVAWVEDPGSLVRAVHIRRDGVVGRVRTLSAPSSVSSAFAFGVAGDGLGNTTVVYNTELPGRKPRSVVQARRFSGGGRLGKPRNLSPKRKAGVVLSVAVVADARGVVTALVGDRATRFVP
jgi:hypothetical protein